MRLRLRDFRAGWFSHGLQAGVPHQRTRGPKAGLQEMAKEIRGRSWLLKSSISHHLLYHARYPQSQTCPLRLWLPGDVRLSGEADSDG